MTPEQKRLLLLALDVVKDTHDMKEPPSSVVALHEFYYRKMNPLDWFTIELEGLKNATIKRN